MNWNQNETGETGVVRREARVLVPQPLTRASRLPTRAFTLTELLVVITIIAVLASLITGAAVNALNRAKQTSITLEIQQLDGAMQDFKNEYGAYPPNGLSPDGIRNNAGILIVELHTSDFVRMFNKAFPRHQESGTLIAALAGGNPGGSATERLLGDGSWGMHGAEAIVFWLGGFSEDPQFPISGPGGPSFVIAPNVYEDLEGRNRRYEFDLGRLGPRESDGTFDTDEDGDGGQGRFITYVDPHPLVNATRRINLWYYVPNGSEQPFGYIDTSRHRAQVETAAGVFSADYDPWLGKTDTATFIYGIKRLNETNPNRIEFVNQGKFQIIHAGLDDAWGDFSVFSLNVTSGNPTLLSTGPFIGDIADTVGNFGTGTLEDEQE